MTLSRLRDRRRASARIAWSDAGITRFQLPTKSADGSRAAAAPAAARRRARHADAGGGRGGRRGAALLRRRGGRLHRVPAGPRRAGAVLRADLRRGAADRLGRTRPPTARLAKTLGAGPEAARDVGQAMAHNPVALIIPCHRVLAAGGKVGGFSAPGGAATKRRMLALEGVSLDDAAGGAAFVRLLGTEVGPVAPYRTRSAARSAAWLPQGPWCAPGWSIRSNPCAPKKSRCACRRFAVERAVRIMSK